MWRNISAVWPVLLLLVSSARSAEDRLAAVDEAIQRFVDARQIAGAVTMLAEAGEVIHLGAVGWADVAKQTPMKRDTLFGIMSMTKPITATALMCLVDDGRISVDDPVDKFIPAFADSKLANGQAVQGLTIRSLLTHTSGLVGEQYCEGSLEETAAMLAKRPFDFQPGSKWAYSPAMNVCGRIIEIVSGKSYEHFLSDRIFKPLAMDQTTFHLSPEQREKVAALYQRDATHGTLAPAERWTGAGLPDAVPNPSAGLFSTATDLFRFYQMILNGGELEGHRVVSADSVHQMTIVQTGSLETGWTPGNGWGLGWCVLREPQGVTKMLSRGTFGHGGGFCTVGRVDPVKQRIFVLLIQQSDVGNIERSDIVREFMQAATDALDDLAVTHKPSAIR
jgi:CubicO group peptidase (beta-lactamase class C family)